MTMSLSSPSTVWIQRPKPNPEARLRLFCFPYAGGGASAYRSWAAHLPDEIEVCAIQLPGRENRLREPLFTRLAPLTETLAGALESSFDIPFAFFGHSMGALIAFELARFIRRRSQITPVHFFASARLAPHVVDSAPPAHRLPEATFLAQIRGLQGTSAVVLDDPEMLRFILPILRADFAINETYTYAPEAPLATPISAFGDLQDPKANRRDLQEWGAHTSGAFNVLMFTGNHFFLNTVQPRLVQAVAEALEPYLQEEVIGLCSA